METIVIEGTWEEIMQRAEELRGKRVRLTVLEEPISGGSCIALEHNPLDAIVGMASSGDGNLSDLHDEVLYQQQ
ncbi:MAG: hypothetical protein KatS3mg022_0153 [Armatimonadota bacterium]|nr:MAG: hypothetical protein KatS3mg022_0153 [Armatimonadota bacterium]